MKIWLIGGILACCAPASAQNFEVASIKPNTSGANGIHGSSDGLQWRLENAPLKWLIQRAWNVLDFQVSGPDWLAGARFDLLAKMPERTSRAELSPMLQHLLEDRFGLMAHHVTREMIGYELVVTKGGTKFRESAPGEGSDVHANPGTLEANGITMEELAAEFAGELGRAVVDRTQLTGRFEVTLKWTRDEQNPDPNAGAEGSIFTAVQEQLGLKLQSARVPVDILVVDHIQRTPTEN